MGDGITPEAEAMIERLRINREREIQQQAKGGKRWWASFDLIEGDYDLHFPSWTTGYSERGRTAVFAAIADTQEAVMAHVESFFVGDYTIEWRFIEERGDNFYPYSDRFPGPSPSVVWPDVPVMPMEDYLAMISENELAHLETETRLNEELRRMTAAEIINRALTDSGALYQEEADEIADGVAEYLRRAGKLIEDGEI